MSHEPPLSRGEGVRYGLGALAMFLAFVIFLVITLNSLFTLSIPLPATFYTNRALWVGAALVLVFVAWVLQTPSTPAFRRWAPTRPGRRFQELRVYGRNGCHLCDEAVDLLEKYHRWLPPFELVNIDDDPKLVERFNEQVPVIECDGKIRFRGRVNEPLLRRLIEGTPPV